MPNTRQLIKLKSNTSRIAPCPWYSQACIVYSAMPLHNLNRSPTSNRRPTRHRPFLPVSVTESTRKGSRAQGQPIVRVYLGQWAPFYCVKPLTQVVPVCVPAGCYLGGRSGDGMRLWRRYMQLFWSLPYCIRSPLLRVRRLEWAGTPRNRIIL